MAEPALARLLIQGRRVSLHWFPESIGGLKALHDCVVEVRRHKRKRTGRQNSRYWALLTVGAVSLWEDASMTDALHEEIAYLLLKLPDCPKTGLRRRMRTPKLNTEEFGRYMDMVANKLIELGADLSTWDAEVEKQERAA